MANNEDPDEDPDEYDGYNSADTEERRDGYRDKRRDRRCYNPVYFSELIREQRTRDIDHVCRLIDEKFIDQNYVHDWTTSYSEHTNPSGITPEAMRRWRDGIIVAPRAMIPAGLVVAPQVIISPGDELYPIPETLPNTSLLGFMVSHLESSVYKIDDNDNVDECPEDYPDVAPYLYNMVHQVNLWCNTSYYCSPEIKALVPADTMAMIEHLSYERNGSGEHRLYTQRKYAMYAPRYVLK
jgi:hypothetical protein